MDNSLGERNVTTEAQNLGCKVFFGRSGFYLHKAKVRKMGHFIFIYFHPGVCSATIEERRM